MNKERLIDGAAKEVLRRQLPQIADISGMEGIFQEFRSQFGAKRENGPCWMKGSEWECLTVLRELRREAFG